MSYSISVSGHGPEADDVREAFGSLVRALRAATPEGGTGPTGSLTGLDSAAYSVDDVTDEAADVEDADTDEADDTDEEPDALTEEKEV
jgi:hypothetical protein